MSVGGSTNIDGRALSRMAEKRKAENNEVRKVLIDCKRWRCDIISVKSIVRRNGSSLYLLLPSELVESLSIKEGQQVWLKALHSEEGGRVGILVDLGVPVISAKVYELNFVVEPADTADFIVRRLTKAFPVYSTFVEKTPEKAVCVIEVLGDDGWYMVELKKFLLKEAKKVKSNISSVNINEQEIKLFSLASSFLKVHGSQCKGCEIRWEEGPMSLERRN